MKKQKNKKIELLPLPLMPISFYKKKIIAEAHGVVMSTTNDFYNTEIFCLSPFPKPISKIL